MVGSNASKHSRGQMKILLVEDDDRTADYILRGAQEHGHVVDRAANGRDGLFLATGEKYDVLVVDRMLPGLDGLALVKSLRAADVKTPMLFLTTMCGIDDRVVNAQDPFGIDPLRGRQTAEKRHDPLQFRIFVRPVFEHLIGQYPEWRTVGVFVSARQRVGA